MSELATAKTRSLSDPLADWALRKVRLEGRRFSFEGHEYLRALYDDTAKHVVVMKAAQVGGTTWAILRSLHTCLSGLNVIYFFPTRSDVIEFSKSRVGPLLEENPFLTDVMTDTDTAGLKRIGDAHLYFRGMKSTVGMKSVPADMMVLDELDEATPEAKSMAKERLSHSDYGRVIELSNPSLPDFGIDEAFQASDQRLWSLKCPGCNGWTALDREFPRKRGEEVRIILPRPDGTFFRACPKCSGELDLSAGEWVATFPGRDVHGYRVSQLISSKVDAGEILREYRTTRFLDRFYNLKIGVPWADLDRRLDTPSVLALCGDSSMLERSDVECTMGVDTGDVIHVVILREDPADRERQHLVHLAVCHEFSELDTLMERFRVDRCVIDGLPETHPTRAFAARHAGKAYQCFFNESQRGQARWDREGRIVQVNRTEALDASRAIVREKRLILPSRQERLIEEFARHMAADAKLLDEDEETGMRRYRYIRTGADHFSLAFTYALLAASDDGNWRGFFRSIRRDLRSRGIQI